MILHRMSHTRIHNIWIGMHTRCNNPNHDNYSSYGGRGIKVCSRWDDFLNFFKDMGDCPENATLERIDLNGNYCPENCRWASKKEQARNRRSNRIIEWNGEKKCLAQWAEDLHLPYKTLFRRITGGWTTKAAFTTPVRKHK